MTDAKILENITVPALEPGEAWALLAAVRPEGLPERDLPDWQWLCDMPPGVRLYQRTWTAP